ncbi:hypothetical protein LguiB_009787 [Lonicera macranthoides]
MDVESCVPPGFRFHPTEEELVGYYLKRKVDSLKIDLQVIFDLDLYRMEPWDIQDRCKLGYEEQNEWYFFSHKDRKYPTGTRTNRATTAGFWKATGRDKAVLSKEKIIGMRKTLVFYKGRAPNGRKTDWIMHEYRLQTSEHGPPQEEGWVVCRAFKKPIPSQKQSNGYYFSNNDNFRPPSFQDTMNTPFLHQNHPSNFHQPIFGSEALSNHTRFDNQLIELPQLDSPTVSTSLATNEDHDHGTINNANQYIGWENLDNLLSSKRIEPALSTYPNMPLIPCDSELDAQNQISHLLGCFPDL